MNKFAGLSVLLAVVLGQLSFHCAAADAAPDNETAAAAPHQVASPWPAQIAADFGSFTVYPPQFDKWENNRLEGRAAVAVNRQGADQPEFGVIWISARTDVDDTSHTVTVRDLAVGKADFPTVAGKTGDYVQALRQQLAATAWQMPLERLQSDLAIDKAGRQAAAQPLKNDVPQIIFSDRPAILVPIDGVPALREVADTGLKRIVNTRALILFDAASVRYYLYVTDHWMEAAKLEGPWTRLASPTAKLEAAKQVAVQQNQVDLLDDEEGGKARQEPAIYVSTSPTELLQTDGPAQYAPVENTRLLYVTNSPNRIFLDVATQFHYVLISGRWYRTRNLSPGSWEYVASKDLPGDFARIPANHPTESVRAAVAGTPQAREAAIANSIPQVATVTRSAATLAITYDGDPSFQPIEGTSLQYAANSPIPVIRVSEESFYALDNGVWFVASSPFGPWSTASYVPAVIYSIPRSSPLHYVTYVRVYDATPDSVVVGYTPGYIGSYVSSDNVVVYGTGWYYRPWIGSVWYGPPFTWGWGFSFVYTWWHPWRPCCVAAWVPPPCFHPWWGPWRFPMVHQPALVTTQTTIINNVTVVNRTRIDRVGVSNIYGRWDPRAVAWQKPNALPFQHRAGPPARVAPGTGYIARPDGSWQRFGDRGGRDAGIRDWRNRDVDRPNNGGPPPIQMPRRRMDLNSAPANSQQVQPQAALPRIQTPFVRHPERVQDQVGQRPPREQQMMQRPNAGRGPRMEMRPERREFSERPRLREDRQSFTAPLVRAAPAATPPVAAPPVLRGPMIQRANPEARGRIEREAGNAAGGGNGGQPQVHGGGGHGHRNFNWGEGRMGEWRR